MSGTWGWPLLLAAATLLGLASGIFGVGIWDWVCWAGLLTPPALLAGKLFVQWRNYRRNRPSGQP
jgi:hypothetical protein